MATEITLSGGYSDVSVIDGEVIVNRLTASIIVDVGAPPSFVPSNIITDPFDGAFITDPFDGAFITDPGL